MLPGTRSAVDVEVAPAADEEAAELPAPTMVPLRVTAPPDDGPAGFELPPPQAVRVRMPRTRATVERLRTLDDLGLDVMRGTSG
jgi:uncharacterized protein YggU (UPF0235/DUF167 family)